MLETRDSVHVAELAETFSVSEVTVRSDLQVLAKQGWWRVCAGGVRALQSGQSEVGFDLRLRLEIERKRRSRAPRPHWSRRAKQIALDASTTAYYLAPSCARSASSSWSRTACWSRTALSESPGITVLVTGGMLRLSAMSLVGDLATDVLRTTSINKGFLGARA